MKKFKELKIGVIGCGYWATNIIKTLENINVKKINVYDNDKKKTNLLKKKFNFVIISNNLEKIINEDIDCYFLVTPASTHFDIAKKLIYKKKNVFIEKPATLKSKHMDELVNLSQKRKTFLMSGYIYNYNVYINYIKKILKNNTL